MDSQGTESAAPEAVQTIAMMTPGWPADVLPNGIVTAVGIIRAEMVRRGVTVKIMTGNVQGDTDDPDIVNLRRFRPPAAPRRLSARLLRRLMPAYAQRRHVAKEMLAGLRGIGMDTLDLLEMEETFGWAAPVARGATIPVVVRLHGPWFLNGEALGVPRDKTFERRVALEGRAVAAAAGITSPSRDTLERTCREYGFTPKRAVVIPYPQALAPVADHWRLDGCERNTILFIGRFDRHKGGDVMIDAFARVAEKHPEARLRFIGPDRGLRDDHGRQWTLPEYAQARLAAPGVAERFEYLGQQPHASLAAHRQQALVTVVPSRYETFGYTAAEAMSQGCPLVAGNGGGLGEVVRDGYSGLQFRAGDAGHLAQQLTTLLSHPERAAELGANALCDCAERFAPAVIARQTLDFYAEIMQAWRAR